MKTQHRLLLVVPLALLALAALLHNRSSVNQASDTQLAETVSGSPTSASQPPRAELRTSRLHAAESTQTNERLLMAATVEEAILAGIFSLRADQFWKVTQTHVDPEVKRLGCMLALCEAHAGRLIQPERHPGYNPNFAETFCTRLVNSGTARAFLDDFSTLNKTQCVAAAQLGPARYEELIRGSPLPESEIHTALSEATDLNEILAYTAMAIRERKAVQGVDFVLLDRLLATAGNARSFNSLLALKFGCRIPGYCASNSPVIALFCAGGIHCNPGDDLSLIAQNNLPPALFEIWRSAHVNTSPGGG